MPLDNSSELFYHVDEDDNVISSITRKQAHSNSKLIHRSIAILLLNEKDQMLFQKRSMLKDLYPGAWSYAVGGHVQVGQSYEQAAMNELQEELGITSTAFEFLKKVIISKPVETEMKSIFRVKVDQPKITPDPTEVEAVEWVALSKIAQFVEKNAVADWTIKALKETNYL